MCAMSKSVKQVQGTNDYSSVSKNSMVQRGYFQDEFIKFFVEKTGRRSPLIHMGYCVRAKIINFIFEKFLKEVADQRAQIVSFGAGFDTSFFRLLGRGILHSKVTYYEIDFKEVVKRKAAIIMATDDLLKTVGDLHIENPDGVYVCSDRYCLIGCNLQDLESLEKILTSAGTNFCVPTLFLAECAITYMDETSSTALINWAALKFENGIFATYEQVYPHDAFGIVMAEHFRSLNTPLLSLSTFPDLESQEERYKVQDWPACVARTVLDVFMHITDHEERRRIFTLEPFDEFEEIHLKCVHYTLSVSAKDSQNSVLTEIQNIPQSRGHKLSVVNHEGIHLDCLNITSEVWRFSHRTAKVSHDGDCVVIGGVGVLPNGKHRRRTEVGLFNLNKSRTARILPIHMQQGADVRLDAMHHTCTTLPNGHVLMLGGRTSPNHAVNTEPIVLAPQVSGCQDTVALDAEVINLSQKGTENTRKPRWRHTAVVVSVEEGCWVFVFGGRTATLEVLDDLWVLDIFRERSAWRVQPVDSLQWPEARCSHIAVTCDTTSMVVSGGLGSRLVPLDDVWQLDVSTMTWRRRDVVMLPRYGHTAHFTSGRLILVGGVNMLACKQPGIAVINTLDWTCVEYALPAQNPRQPLMLHNHSTELCEDGTIIVIGGGGNCFSFGTAFNKYLGVINIKNLLSTIS